MARGIFWVTAGDHSQDERRAMSSPARTELPGLTRHPAGRVARGGFVALAFAAGSGGSAGGGEGTPGSGGGSAGTGGNGQAGTSGNAGATGQAGTGQTGGAQ